MTLILYLLLQLQDFPTYRTILQIYITINAQCNKTFSFTMPKNPHSWQSVTCLDSSSFIQFLYLGGLEEQLHFSAHRCMEQTYIQHHSNFLCILTCGKWWCQFAYPNTTWYRRRVWYSLIFRLIPTLHNNGVWNLQIIYAQHQMRLDVGHEWQKCQINWS